MVPKRVELTHPGIFDACVKYLYFISFVKAVSTETVRAYQSDLAQAFQFSPDFFDQKMSNGEIPRGRPGQIPDADWLNLCRAALLKWSDLAPASRNRKTACLKSLLNWLHDEEAIERDLAVHLHAPRAPIRVPHFISVDEVMALLDSLRRDEEAADSSEARESCIRDTALILLLYGGGLRVSEACSLKWEQIEGDGTLLRIHGKGSQERLVAIPPLARAAVQRLRRTFDFNDFVFGEQALSTRVAYRIVRSRGARCGLLQPLHPHALRHSYATHLLSSGANLRTLQDLLGHRSLQATQRYTHLGLDQLANTLENFHPLGSEAANAKSRAK